MEPDQRPPPGLFAAGRPLRPFRLLFAASEAAPFAKTGGLADVVGSLPRALAARGHECAVILPLYRSARKTALGLEPAGGAFEVLVGHKRVPGRLWRSRLPNSTVPVFLVEQTEYFERDDPTTGRGLYQYRLPTGQLRDYPDNCQRFIFFSRAVLEAVPTLGFKPDVIHCSDWQTGLAPVYLRELYGQRLGYAGIRTLFTIHNLAYQGVFWHWDMTLTGLDWGLFNWRQLEFFGHLNLLKAGMVFADAMSTVSPRYAEEIQTPAFGCGLESVIRHYRSKLAGIMNGVEYGEWDPAGDRHLAAPYNGTSWATGKAACKADLQRRFGLPERAETPVLAFIGRLVDQKLRVLRDTPMTVLEQQLLGQDVQLVVLGIGDAVYHRLFAELTAQHPERVAAKFEFSEALSHQIEAGADVFLMPSQFEPMGLNQLYSLKYGTVPVVHDTGGLHDSVVDCTPETLAAGTATGFVFREYRPPAFLAAVRRALQIFREQPDGWRELQRIGMCQDWSWRRSAAEYERLYARIIEQPREEATQS